MSAVADVQETGPDPELEALRERWAPEWCVWRARRSDGRPGSLMATRRGVGRRLSMTLMERTAEELEAALREHDGRVGQALMRAGYPE